jgi:hypothetical protein
MEVSTMTNPNGLVARRIPFPRFLAQVILGGALVLASVPAFAGPIGWDAFGGRYTDRDEFFLGAGARIGAAAISFNPNAEYIFTDSGTSYTLNLDGTMTVLPLGVGSGWIGAGLTFFTVDPDQGDSTTETGVNVLAGFGLSAVPFKPYAQLKSAFIEGDNPFAITVGIRF